MLQAAYLVESSATDMLSIVLYHRIDCFAYKAIGHDFDSLLG